MGFCHLKGINFHVIVVYLVRGLNAPVYVVSAVVLVQFGMVIPTVWVSNGGVGMH